MLTNYFKIFLKIASQNKLFTFLSLFGISLTIMFVMIFSMALSKITTGAGPESELKKIIFCQRVLTRSTEQVKKGGGSISSCGRTLCEDYLKRVKSAEYISMYGGAPWEFIFNGKYQKKEQTNTDAEYWNIFQYDFLQGRPYTREEVVNKANLAVITRSLKELLFGTEENVLGKTVHYTSLDLTVIGVVDDPPETSQNATGDLYIPYTLLNESNFADVYTGEYKVAFKAESRKQFKIIRHEAQNIIAQLDASDTTKTVFLSGPYTQLEKMMVGYGNPEDYSLGSSLLRYLIFALAFILLPAVNLMALNFARINERGEEIAVRKSFGAANSVLRGQFLFENILMTLAGGIIGIVLSYILVALLGNSLSLSTRLFFNVPLTYSFNVIVFLVALITCLLFGLLSGYLPAVRLSRMKPAVYMKGGEL